MSRYARTGLVAVLLLGMIWICAPLVQTRAAAPNLTHRLYLSSVAVNPPTTASTPPFNTAPELQVVDLINQQRRANGCGNVTLNRELSVAGRNHSQDMAENNYFSHTGRNGSSFSDRAKAAGYEFFPSGEIIAAGYSDAQAVVQGWMDSAGHRKIILTCANDDIGVGLFTKAGSQYGNYWTAVFGQR